MVPEVDKRDTELLLREQREILEATRQEILSWAFFGKDDTAYEMAALLDLASRSAQQARQWIGQMLGELGTAYPYQNSLKPENQTIDPSTVQAKPDYFPEGEQTIISRIKFARLTLQGVDKNLETLLSQCKPYTRFNQFLFKVQEHAMQAKMWLGELLNELREEEKPALVSFEDIKDKLVGEPGTPEREQYEQQLATEIAELNQKQDSAAGESASSSPEEPIAPASPTGSGSETGNASASEDSTPATEPQQTENEAEAVNE